MIELLMFLWLLALKRKKKDKKGWMKILEASISITILMGFMVLVYNQTIEKAPPGEDIIVWEKVVLESIVENHSLRYEILTKPNVVCDPEQGGLVYGFILERITRMFPGFGFACRVCEPGEICGMPSYHEEAYSEERIISATLTIFSPKKIRLFVWPLKKGEEIKPLRCTPNWECSYTECSNKEHKVTCNDTNKCVRTQITYTEKCRERDTTPPGNVMSLVCGTPGSYINLPISCNWTNPYDRDLNEINIYLDNSKIATLPKTQTNYSIPSNLTPYRIPPYIVSIKTKDTHRNEQTTGVMKSCIVNNIPKYSCN